MKPIRFLFASAALTALSFAGAAYAADASAPAKTVPAKARVEVVFSHPENFTDVKDSSMSTEKGRDYILSEFKEFIEKRAVRTLPADDNLEITFTNIDLAGEYEPWRMPPADNIRVVKDLYPPRFEFAYKIVNAKTGAEVRAGKENLTDLNFMSRLVLHRSDELAIEKDLLGDWLDSHLNTSKAKK